MQVEKRCGLKASQIEFPDQVLSPRGVAHAEQARCPGSLALWRTVGLDIVNIRWGNSQSAY